jgi:hypothetical protein
MRSSSRAIWSLSNAGCYGEVIIRRWHDELDRVMRDFKQNGDDPLFPTLSTGAAPPELPARYRDCFATYGRTLSLDGAELTGFAAILQSQDRAAAIALLTEAFPGSAHDVHRWRIGGDSPDKNKVDLSWDARPAAPPL